MYTDSGKAHINATLSELLASHIGFGIDSFDTTGDSVPLLTDRHHSAWSSAIIPVVTRTVVGKDIVFATSHDTNRFSELIANTMSLYARNTVDPPNIRVRRNVFSDFSTGWTNTVALTPSTTPAAWFSLDGGAAIAQNTTASISGSFSLLGYGANDYISIPIFWTGNEPTGGTLKATFHFLLNGTVSTYELSNSVITTGSSHKFPGIVTSGAIVTSSMSSPKPTVWASRLGSGTQSENFLANLDKIVKLELTWTVATATSKLYFGSPQITPDFDADNSGIVIAYGTLSSVVVNPFDNYGAAEYRIPGL
jgi:hypothetical protein